MDDSAQPPTALSARRFAVSALLSSAKVGAVGLTLSGVLAVSGWGVACPWRTLTGTLCPLCGATTLGTHLLGGDIRAAWESNQLVFTGGLIWLIFIGLWSVAALGGPALWPPLKSMKWLWLSFGLAGLLFMIWRNTA